MPDYLLRIWTPFCAKPVRGVTPFTSLDEAQKAYDAAVKDTSYTTVQLRERGEWTERVIAERRGA